MAGLVTVAILFAGCDRLVTPHHAQQLKDAEAKAATGDHIRAISLYESALEDRPSDAEIHYKLGLLYDDKLNDRLDALHHFKRYLAIAPSGAHAADLKNFIRRDEVALLTDLSGDAVMPRAEATRLRNENQTLRRELDEARGRVRPATNEIKTDSNKSKSSGGRTYVVQRGDTLASISRKFYKTSAHWKRILDANRAAIDDPRKLTAGQALVIPVR